MSPSRPCFTSSPHLVPIQHRHHHSPRLAHHVDGRGSSHLPSINHHSTVRVAAGADSSYGPPITSTLQYIRGHLNCRSSTTNLSARDAHVDQSEQREQQHLPRINGPYYGYSSILLLVTTASVLLLLTAPVADSVRVVSLNVPSRVRKGTDLELSCLFDLGNATLYSLKWFYRAHEWDRDEQEFFRYTPRLKPYKQVFPLEGIQVDIDRSGGGTVFIREANGKTSGKYKCEISVDGTFQTVAAEKLMTVFNSNGSSTRAPLSSNSLHHNLQILLLHLLVGLILHL